MLNPFQIEDPDLDRAIAQAYNDLKALSATDEGYQSTVDQLTKLYKLRHDAAQHFHDAQAFEFKHMLEADAQAYAEEQNELPWYQRVDPNTVVAVAGNLLLGLIVVKYEQTGVIQSKAMSLIKKI